MRSPSKIRYNIGCVRWLLFALNFVFCIAGLAMIIVGVLAHVRIEDVNIKVFDIVKNYTTAIMIIGCVIFVIAFFGCLGAIRESYWMVLTFGIFLMIFLIAQIGLAITTFLAVNNEETGSFRNDFHERYFMKYDRNEEIIDIIQKGLKCCGVDARGDYQTILHKEPPKSCCNKMDNAALNKCSSYYETGCVSAIEAYVHRYGGVMGGLSFAVGLVELASIVSAFLMAAAIKNAELLGARI